MDLSGFRSESHVAQQSRRHKLRVQQDNPNNLDHFAVPQDLIQVPNLSFATTGPYTHPSTHQTVFSSEMLNYGDNSQPILAQELGQSGPGRVVPDGYPRPSGELQNCGIWRTVNLDQNFGYSSGGLQGSDNNRFMNNVSASGLYVKPGGYNGYQDVVVTSNPSDVPSPKQYGEMQFGSSSVYHPAAASGGRGGWNETGNELVLLPPTYGAQPNPAWPDELGLFKSSDRDQLRNVGRDCTTQSLSLSLCPTKTNASQFGVDGGSKALEESNAGQVVMGSSTFPSRNTGPLGPFTGYATILKCSKFLKPAQQLLEEICSLNGEKLDNVYESPDKDSGGGTSLREAIRAADSAGDVKGGGDSSISSSAAYGSSEISGDVGGRSGFGPEYQQKKAKLLFMQDEVCRRYKQYHQQMEMVVSSFESVAGLSAATPYISLALKTISRHFRCLKNAILEQLKHIRNALGEEFMSPTGASSSKGEHSNTSRLKFIEHGFNTPKSSGGNLGFFEPQQQHVWRPQRGLPERAVSVLRAWLFEHFLHPYPTDTDKHMLAAQTGLSRNQVSNWFINARVRVWKPMVEEIHMLETTGLPESNPNEPKTTLENVNPSGESQPRNKFSATAASSNVSFVGRGEDGQNPEEWNQEKRSRVECQIPDTMDASLMGFMPYQRSGLEMSGLGAVSLTLGLRQSPDGTQQLQQQEHQLRQHYGGQMIHDFVG